MPIEDQEIDCNKEEPNSAQLCDEPRATSASVAGSTKVGVATRDNALVRCEGEILKPPVTKSRANLFPMAGLWSQKKLLQTTNMTRGVKKDEQIEACKEQGKRHNKTMYPEKEYLEEYLKFKDVIGSSKK